MGSLRMGWQLLASFQVLRRVATGSVDTRWSAALINAALTTASQRYRSLSTAGLQGRLRDRGNRENTFMRVMQQGQIAVKCARPLLFALAIIGASSPLPADANEINLLCNIVERVYRGGMLSEQNGPFEERFAINTRSSVARSSGSPGNLPAEIGTEEIRIETPAIAYRINRRAGTITGIFIVSNGNYYTHRGECVVSRAEDRKF
jgi:hypothetical protein